jgi:hypothetical protein
LARKVSRHIQIVSVQRAFKESGVAS